VGQTSTRPDGGVSIVLIADRAHHPAERILDGLAATFEVVPGAVVRVIERASGAAPAASERVAWLHALKRLTSPAGAEFLVSRRLDLALALGLDGVQLPEDALPLERVRDAFPRLILGRSCHDRQGLARAEGVADFALLSPLAAPHSKPATSPPLGIAGFAAATAGLAIPVFALGGIVSEHIEPLRRAGAAGVALLGGAFDAASPRAVAERVRAIHEAWLAAACALSGPRAEPDLGVNPGGAS
jgi:thiamine-phosphate diphosphorylase